MPASRSLHENDSSVDEPNAEPEARRTRRRGLRRLIAALVFLLVVLLMAVVPPLLNISRFQRRIERSISTALGRPVHFDRVTLNLLPLPGFTLENFVVDEDPAFGAEPIIRAATVDATVRFSSLWRRRVEISKISLGEPTSVNLVHTADGRWNIQSLLMQASHIQAAPTAQAYSGPAPRFPYIEATGARLNLKLDRNGIQEKTPFSLTDAEFSLWLPEPHQWHLRLEAHPVRTDSTPADTGTVRVEGTLGSADGAAGQDSLAQLPLDLSGEWSDAQLGGLSHLLMGRDGGLRGELTLTGNVSGTLGHNAIAAKISLTDARRAAFVPPDPLDLEATCQAIAQQSFHSFSEIVCRWPPAGSSDPTLVAVTADVPDIRTPDSVDAELNVPGVPTATALDWLSLVTARPPAGVLALGTLSGHLVYHAPAAVEAKAPRAGHARAVVAARPNWSGEFTLTGGSLKIAGLGARPIPLDDVTLQSSPGPMPGRGGQQTDAVATSFDLLPVTLPLGGRQPAVIEAHFNADGYTLHLSGSATTAALLALGDAVPQLGDGLQEFLQPETSAAPAAAAPSTEPDAGTAPPIHVDATATRPWGGQQVWTAAAAPKRPVRRHSH